MRLGLLLHVKTIAFDALVENPGITVQCADHSILESISFKMLNIVDGDFRVNTVDLSCHKLTHLALSKLTFANNFLTLPFPQLQ